MSKLQNCNILWYIIVYYGILWYIMVYFGILWFFGNRCDVFITVNQEKNAVRVINL